MHLKASENYPIREDLQVKIPDKESSRGSRIAGTTFMLKAFSILQEVTEKLGG